MRATGGTLQFRRSNSSRRICQMRPTTKPNASETKIWSTVTATTLIGLPFLAKAHTLWHRMVTHFLPASDPRLANGGSRGTQCGVKGRGLVGSG
jgi:hypothetical protein